MVMNHIGIRTFPAGFAFYCLHFLLLHVSGCPRETLRFLSYVFIFAGAIRHISINLQFFYTTPCIAALGCFRSSVMVHLLPFI